MLMENNIRKRATAIIIENGKILLIKRIKSGMEYFVVPGGGVEEGETLEHALVREVAEELSLKVEDFCEVGRVENVKMIHIDLQSYYFFHIKKYSGTLALGGEEKASMTEDNQYHFVWIPISELETTNNLYPPEVVQVLVSYLNKS